MPVLVSILAVTAAFASASGTLGSTDFRYTGAAEVAALPADGVPAVGQAREVDQLVPAPSKLVDLHLLAQSGRKSLFSTTDTLLTPSRPSVEARDGPSSASPLRRAASPPIQASSPAFSCTPRYDTIRSEGDLGGIRPAERLTIIL